MFSTKVICLVFCVQISIVVRANKSTTDEVSNSTVAEDRSDFHANKPPRRKDAFGLAYSSSFGRSFYPNYFKLISQFKKGLTPPLVEKYIPVPVHVKVPIDRPVPAHVPKLVPVAVEKAVPVPIKVNVPQPYPVYKKIAVPVKISVDRPVPVHVLKPFSVVVEKQVPYPVENPVAVPVKIPVDRPYLVYVLVEKSTSEKPTATQIEWIPEKPLSMSAGSKSLAWLENAGMQAGLSFKMASASEDVDNKKLVASLLENSEPSESDVVPLENIELEIK